MALLHRAADAVAALELAPRPPLARELRLCALLQEVADRECDRLGEPRGVWWRAGRSGRAIRAEAARVALAAGYGVVEVAAAAGLDHSTVSKMRRAG